MSKIVPEDDIIIDDIDDVAAGLIDLKKKRVEMVSITSGEETVATFTAVSQIHRVGTLMHATGMTSERGFVKCKIFTNQGAMRFV